MIHGAWLFVGLLAGVLLGVVGTIAFGMLTGILASFDFLKHAVVLICTHLKVTHSHQDEGDLLRTRELLTARKQPENQ